VATLGKERIAAAGRAQAAAVGSSYAYNIPPRWFVPPLPWAGLTFALAAAIGWPKTPPLVADSIAYRALALGRFGEVSGAISGRLLHPASVRFLSWSMGLDIAQAFFVMGLVALALFVGSVAWILKQVTGFGALVLPLLLTPVLIDDIFGLYYCQDLFYAALSSCFLVMLIKRRTGLALILLFPLYLTRESTILLALVWAGIAWCDSDFLVAKACALVTVVGLLVTRTFASLGTANVHHTSELVFLALKPPFDSLRNFLGIVLVTSEMRGRPGYTCAPFATVHLPRLLSYGSTTQFGICSPDLGIPLHTLTLWLSLFGIGPAVLFTLLRRSGRRTFADSPVWLRLATLYGLLAFFIAPFVSFWLERDIGYAWPAFWLAAPAIFTQVRASATPGVVAALLLENLAACWIPYALAVHPGNHGRFQVVALCVALAMQAAALWTLKHNSAVTTLDSRTRIARTLLDAHRGGPTPSPSGVSVRQ
jgi:hypothetical protein